MSGATSLFWLSFVDDERPAGQQFLGACLVPASEIVEAVKVAHALGCNPGGEVVGHPVPADRVRFVRATWVGRLLNRAECQEVGDEVARALPS